MLLELNATVTLCHSKTKNIWEHINTADLIVSAVGKAGFLNCYPIHVPIVDVGINFDKNGKLVGDCFNTEGRDVTPVPGGVGLLTRIALLENTLLAAQIRRIKDEQCNSCK
jgi:methylenetetrahydrofolate dehydrogenase (NADP+)/methenyltetrahydrofolate cyclohydrolase